jgi:protocatechuate 3,4-dioxygenase beta subunit
MNDRQKMRSRIGAWRQTSWVALLSVGALWVLAGCASPLPAAEIGGPDAAVTTTLATAEPVQEVTDATEAPSAVAAPRPATSAQQKGPYYPITEPAERDNDLTSISTMATALGDVLLLNGRLLTTDGLPLPGATIEIWQTDGNGVYLHPNDPGFEQRDRNFQFYGEAITDAAGRYSFRTIMPGPYEPRPRHIHFKVKLDGAELLTSQLYFSNDAELANARVPADLVVNVAAGQDERGGAALVGEQDIVVTLR